MYKNYDDSQFISPKGIFSRGLIDNVANEEIPDANSPYLRNARIYGFGTKIRAGVTQLATCPLYPISHLGYWNRKQSDGTEKNLLVYVQNNTNTQTNGQPGLYDIDGAACSTLYTPTRQYWLGPCTQTFSNTPIANISFRAELGSFADVSINDAGGNVVQQFDPSFCTNANEFTTFYTNYPNQTIADWNNITNGVIHVDYGDGIIRDINMDFSGAANMAAVFVIFANALNGLLKWQTITTGYIKIDGTDIGPIDLSTVTNIETVAVAINLAFGQNIAFVRYSVNQSGEVAPYMFFQITNLVSVDRATTGQGPELWELLGGDQLSSTSQFVSSRLQTVRMSVSDRLYASQTSDAYYIYNVDSAQKGFYVIDQDGKVRIALKPNNLKPSIGVIFDSFHFISGDATQASTLSQSVRSYYEDFESLGSDEYTFDGMITGLEANNNEMYVFTKTSIGLLQAGGYTQQGGIYRFNIRPLETQEGALSQGGIISVGSRVFFWTPSNKIKEVGRSADGVYEVRELSHREGRGIDQTMQYAIEETQDKLFAEYSPKENLIKWHCKSYGGTGNDTVIIYDLNNDTFLVDTYQILFIDHAAHDGRNLYYGGKLQSDASTVAHKIYKDGTGTNDAGGTISFAYDTKRFTFGDPTIEKQYWGARILAELLNVGSQIDFEIWVAGVKVHERGLTGSLGNNLAGSGLYNPFPYEVSWPVTKGNLRAKGRDIQFKFRSTSFNSQGGIKSLSIEVLGMPLKTSNKNNS